jgi:hypothetical protein
VCGRTFNADRIKKHQAACKLSNTKKKKVFNSAAKRLDGVATTHEEARIVKSSIKKKKVTGGGFPGNKKAKWAHQSNALRQALRAGRGEDAKTETFGGQSYGADEDYVEDNGMTKCKYCNRTFNE